MASSSQDNLPEGWEARVSRSTGLTYYLNVQTKTSQWDKPDGLVAFVEDDEDDNAAALKQVKCSHVMVKHVGSRRPSSWREKNITRSKDEALAIIKDYRRKIINKDATFKEIAKQFSDCSSAKRSGDLGYFKKARMQKPFSKIAFGLKIGQLSQIVETESGFHIILRTA